MSTEMWRLEKDLCRCCHTEGWHENLFATPTWKGFEQGPYADMLRECFDIELSSVRVPSQKQTCTICLTCIDKLEQALAFKRQVQKCESRLRNIILNHIGKDATILMGVKVELPDSDDDEKPPNLDLIKFDHDEKIQGDETIPDDETPDHNDDDELPLKSEDTGDIEDPVISSGSKKRNHAPSIARSGKKAKISSSKVKKKKEKLTKKKTKPKKKEQSEDTEEGDVKVGKRNRMQEDIDYKYVDDMYQCCRCEYKCKNKKLLRSHILQVHVKTPKYTCTICSKKFFTLVPYMRHKFEEHDIDDRAKCNACESTFNTKVQLKRHINGFHMLGAKYKCKDCEYECFGVEPLYKHKLKHKPVKDYHCAYCKKCFLRKSNLRLHERIHTGDRRKVCKVCGQAFVQKASLNYHMTKYHPGVAF